MAIYKEIVTKAIVGKGKRRFKNSYTVEVNETPDTILGCWVINHQFNGYKDKDKVRVKGSFDINLWYAYDSNAKTSVISKTIEYDELFNVRLKDGEVLDNEHDIIVRSLYQPNCSDATSEGNSIKFNIDKELGIEVVGDTKVKIAIEDDEDPWDILEEDLTNEDEKQIDEEVNENYL